MFIDRKCGLNLRFWVSFSPPERCTSGLPLGSVFNVEWVFLNVNLFFCCRTNVRPTPTGGSAPPGRGFHPHPQHQRFVITYSLIYFDIFHTTSKHLPFSTSKQILGVFTSNSSFSKTTLPCFYCDLVRNGRGCGNLRIHLFFFLQNFMPPCLFKKLILGVENLFITPQSIINKKKI